ncbi:MAG: methylenetetrahydrofolate--tRNA-(uracil(54)-C(5))-methyltransferase (FADH(2)-oxidizing) TrmFO [Acidobacteriota bacterium]
MSEPIHIVGGGLAGSECAYQLAERGQTVVLHEMRPAKTTPAHSTEAFAELVCSNSLRCDDPDHAAGLLKREMETFGSLVIGAARRHAVPAGSALAVDRDRFSADITATLLAHPRIEVRRGEVTEFPAGRVVLATGPLTSPALSRQLAAVLGGEHLYFYDSIAPILEADSLDMAKLFRASRWGKGNGDDYVNAPMDKEQYLAFHRAIVEAEVLPLHDFEQGLFFEGCLPIEEMARRGVDTLRYGPMKPVGLRTPEGKRPWAVVQLRQENLAQSHYNLVGFQSRMKWPDQTRVFRTIPGLENASFVRLGQVHRNTFINAPTHLDRFYRLKNEPRLRLAGQITGVEGYLESAATGLAVALYLGLESSPTLEPLPPTTALGALMRHLVESDPRYFQPANINYGLFPPLEQPTKKDQRRGLLVGRAHRDLRAWAKRQGIETLDVRLAPDPVPETSQASPPAAL